MSDTIILAVKAKHFKRTKFYTCGHCPIARAAKELFKTSRVGEFIDELHIKNAVFKHKIYNPTNYNKHHALASAAGYDDSIIFNLEFRIKRSGMKSGIELIAEERREQIEKHGFNYMNDMRYNNHELVTAAEATIKGNKKWFPHSWQDSPFVDKICSKPYYQRLIIAGALIAAEIDRLNNNP